MKRVFPSSCATIKGAIFEGKWKEIINTEVPLVSINSPHDFNQFVGYVKFINGSNGTVLYRGQNKDYGNLQPSGARSGEQDGTSHVIQKIVENSDMRRFFKLDEPEISDLKSYQELVVEATLQHYEAKTYCMDFVDNHWCALWFGLYEKDGNGYRKRKNGDEDLYIYLYLADTNHECIRGIYRGEEEYIVDLRKAIPSYFLRPASQHGWVVRKKERGPYCDYKDKLLCVIKIKVSDADKWLGDGFLLSQDNFFPNYNIDEGYNVLLGRQERSGVKSPKERNQERILPIGTIVNHHHNFEYILSEKDKCLTPKRNAFYQDSQHKRYKIDSIASLYEILLEKGWSQESCEEQQLWEPENPCSGQSRGTALLVKEIFGGEILRCERGQKWHYYNRIDGIVCDLTKNENIHHPFENNYDEDKVQNGIQPNKVEEAKRQMRAIEDKIGLHWLD